MRLVDESIHIHVDSFLLAEDQFSHVVIQSRRISEYKMQNDG
jgi:hypothetical protein